MKNKLYDLKKSPLYRLSSLRRLAQLLRVPVKDLRHVDRLIHYQTFKKPKPNGSYRVISSPDPQLKKLQRYILLYFRRIYTPEWLISGRKGKSYIDNARMHQNSHYVVTADISRFFDNCSSEKVYELFKNRFLMPCDIATVLTKLTTYNFHIPTGTPTSQALAFWSNRDMFERISKIAENEGMLFSLYVDDLTFSSIKPAANIIPQISCILAEYQHSVKKEKVRKYNACEYKHITGVAISPDGKLCVPNKLRLKIINERHQMGDACLKSLTFKGRIVAA